MFILKGKENLRINNNFDVSNEPIVFHFISKCSLPSPFLHPSSPSLLQTINFKFTFLETSLKWDSWYPFLSLNGTLQLNSTNRSIERLSGTKLARLLHGAEFDFTPVQCLPIWCRITSWLTNLCYLITAS